MRLFFRLLSIVLLPWLRTNQSICRLWPQSLPPIRIEMSSARSMIGILWVGSALLIGCVEAPTETVAAPKPEATLNPLLLARTPVPSSLSTSLTLPSSMDVPAEEGQAESEPTASREDVSAPTVPQPTVAPLLDGSIEVALVPTPTQRPPTVAEDEYNLVTLSLGSEYDYSGGVSEILIYDDELDSNWTLENSQGVDYDLVTTARWYEKLDKRTDLTSGALSISLKPRDDFGTIFFTVRPESSASYSRDEILGVSFWLHTGTDIVDTGDFAVTVVGSNEQTYWSSDDESVFFDGDDSFSETRLYFLDINRAIPSDSWVKIEVWLDELLYDPDYEYVTGIYVKNDAGFRNTVYIDRMALLHLREDGS
ncbi:MAG: hypothetical protein AAF702_15055 [Chloroflexota bacterium]